MRNAIESTRDPRWVLTHEGYNVMTENAVESRFALGNGFLGMRASRPVSRGPTWVSWLGHIRWASWPRCYFAGLVARDSCAGRQPATAAGRRVPRQRASARYAPRHPPVGPEL